MILLLTLFACSPKPTDTEPGTTDGGSTTTPGCTGTADGALPKGSVELSWDDGTLLKPKEAYRYLSHKFHGVKSGSKKEDNRKKRLLLQRKMQGESAATAMAAKLRQAQKKNRKAFVVLEKK